MTMLFPLPIETFLAEAVTDTSAVTLAGPSQAGKKTLVCKVAGKGLRFLPMDDELTMLPALQDPVDRVRSIDRAGWFASHREQGLAPTRGCPRFL